MSSGDYPAKWRLHTSSTATAAATAGMIEVVAWHPHTDMALVKDSSGTITIPGDSNKYRRANNAAEATKVNPTVFFDVATIKPTSTTKISTTKLTTTGTSTSTKDFLKKFLGDDANGYTDDGFAVLKYGDHNWLKMMLNTKSTFKDNEIPGGSVVTF